jgi:hypothetical protein
MAAIKALLAACATLGVLWRLGAPIAPGRWLLYAGACAAMAAGPGLIWHMEHVRTGAALLHGGLLAAVVALFRDPAVGDLLRSLTSRRAAK